MTESVDGPVFALNGGNPVLDFVNTLDNRFRDDGPVELLESYGDLLHFMQQSGLLDARQAGQLLAASKPGAQARALRSARELREAAAAALYNAAEGSAPNAAHIGTIERYFLRASRHRRLRWQQSWQPATAPSRAAWVWDGHAAEVELPVWILAQAASELLSSDALGRLRTCGSDRCRWLFLDTSKNHSRRWCDMKICGNRMKAQRFYARRRA